VGHCAIKARNDEGAFCLFFVSHFQDRRNQCKGDNRKDNIPPKFTPLVHIRSHSLTNGVLYLLEASEQGPHRLTCAELQYQELRSRLLRGAALGAGADVFLA